MSNLSQFIKDQFGFSGPGTGMKSSIILFDSQPGTKEWVCPPGVFKIRAFVVGGGANGTDGGSGGGGSVNNRGGAGGIGGNVAAVVDILKKYLM